MINTTVYNAIWSALLDVERYCRYYEAQHTRMARQHMIIRFLALISIVVAATPAVNIVPHEDIARIALFILATGLTIWDAIANYSKHSTVAQLVYIQCDKLRSELRHLWMAVKSGMVDTEEALQQLHGISKQIIETAGWATANDNTVDEKSNNKTQRDAYKSVEQRFGETTPTT